MRNPAKNIPRVIGLLLALGGLILNGSPVSKFVKATIRPSQPDATLSIPGWNLSSNLNKGRLNHTATLLPNGKVLVAGGYGVDGPLNNAQLFDPATGTWNSAGTLTNARVGHTATLLANGKVLVAGGVDSGKTAELYDPATQTWSLTGGLNIQRDWPTATLLANGKVLVAGGGVAFVSPQFLGAHPELRLTYWPPTIFESYYPTNSAELYEPA